MKNRPFVKRVALWTASATCLLASYVAGAPVVAGIVQERFPAAEPVIKVLYVPLIYYTQHADLPGSGHYALYASTVERHARDWAR